MKKRIIGVFLTMIMVAGLIPNAYAASEIELIDKLSGNTIPYVVSGVSPDQDKIYNFKCIALY